MKTQVRIRNDKVGRGGRFATRGLALLGVALLVSGCEVEHHTVVTYPAVEVVIGEPVTPIPGRQIIEFYFWVTGPEGMPLGQVRVSWEDVFHAHTGEAGVTAGFAFHDPSFLIDAPVNLYPPPVLDAPVGTELMFRFQKPGYLDAWLVYPVPGSPHGTTIAHHQIVVMQPWVH